MIVWADSIDFLSESLWQAEGSYSDAKGNGFEAKGDYKLSIQGKLLELSANLVLKHEELPGKNFTENYKIEAFKGECDYTNWQGTHSQLGELTGHFWRQEGIILADFTNPTQNISGSYSIALENQYSYRLLGSAFRGKKKLFSYNLLLTKLI